MASKIKQHFAKAGGSRNETIYEKDKVGNLLIRLINFENRRGEDMYLTKLLKLLFIIDEQAVIETGAPVTSLTYDAWELGPVARSVYGIRHNSGLFDEYVGVIKEESSVGEQVRFNARKPFEDGEFSDYEIGLIDRVYSKYGTLSGNDLITVTHRKGSIYDQVVKTNNLKFKSGKTSSFKVPLDLAVKNDPEKRDYFHEVHEGVKFQHHINNM